MSAVAWVVEPFMDWIIALAVRGGRMLRLDAQRLSRQMAISDEPGIISDCRLAK